MIQNFVIANINDNKNHVLLYDERGQDKGADCLCSLRIRYHIMQRDRYNDAAKKPSVSISILDNCIGQNKSNLVMKFNAMLSLLFYSKVVLLYLISGHSHMIADRIVAWIKAAIRGKNIYCPQDLAKECNNVHSVCAEFLDHNSSKRPFFIGWAAILNKYFNDMPAQNTFNYFFEFDCGVCTMRHLTSTVDADAVRFSMVKGNPTMVTKAILYELFGVDKVSLVSLNSLDTIKLKRHEGNKLPAKKVASISEKYFAIPPEHRGYYPVVEDSNGVAADDDVAPVAKKTKYSAAPASRKPGRPHKIVAVPTQSSILSFF